MKAAGHWLCAVGTKNKTKAIDRNLSSTLIRPHQGWREREREQEGKTGKGGREIGEEKTEVQGQRRTELKNS